MGSRSFGEWTWIAMMRVSFKEAEKLMSEAVLRTLK